MLATKRQIEYLQHLNDRAVYLKGRHPSLIPDGIFPTKWDFGMSSEKASARIEYYKAILTNANNKLYRR